MIQMTDRTIKNNTIRESKKATIERHSKMLCRTFTFKIDKSGLRPSQQRALKMLFVESKWIYNDIITSMNNGIKIDINAYKNYKDSVRHLDKDRNEVRSEINYMTSRVCQGLVSQIKNNIKSLGVLKSHNRKVGALKYKSEYNSIPFDQYYITHRIVSSSRIKIAGIKLPIRVSGLRQIKDLKEAEYTTLKLLKRADEYFISLTVFTKPERKASRPLNKPVGIDMGIKDHLTLSDGRTFNVMVGESERLKRLQKKLSRQKKGSNNHYRTRIQIQREYMKMDWKKNDLANKICNDLLSNYSHVYFQDENLNGWKVRYGKTIQHSVLGRVKSTLRKHKDQCTMLSRYLPTTKLCPECGSLNESITLQDRSFKCPHCGYFHPSRDVHAACNMIKIGQGLAESKACGDSFKEPLKQEAAGSSAQR